jgi:hypothetical protein
MVAAEDVADVGAMDIPLDHKKRRQVKTDAAPKQQRIPLLGVSVDEPGAAERAEGDGQALLSPDGRSEQADTEPEAENSSQLSRTPCL